MLGKLLGGWNVSGTQLYHTGHPITVTFDPSAVNLPDGNDHSDQRPDRAPGVSVVPANQNANNWINPSAFQSPPSDSNGSLLRFGNAGRGVVRSPNVWQTDLSLAKTTKLSERFSLEFRVAAFNPFNHDQLADPNLQLHYAPACNNPDPTVCSPIVPVSAISAPSSFGQITSLVNFNNNNDSFAPDNVGSGTPRQIQFSLRLAF